jgi:hypothetical protein
MFRNLVRAMQAAALALLALQAGAASAATLTLQSSFDLQTSDNGPDTPGLNGAKVLLQADFAEGTVFTRDGFDVPRAVASNVTFTISGALNVATNGIYMATAPLGLFASGNQFDGLFTSGPGTNVFVPGGDATFFGIAGIANQIRLDAGGTVGTHALGDVLTLATLQNVQLATGGVVLFSQSGQGGTSYSVRNATTSAFGATPSPVPLPAGLPLLAGGLVILGGLTLRRRSAGTMAA